MVKKQGLGLRVEGLGFKAEQPSEKTSAYGCLSGPKPIFQNVDP